MEIEAAGARLAYEESGEGRPVVVVHDLARDRTVQHLPALGGRAIAYARRGYGGSTAPEGYAATTVEEQTEDLVALLRGLGAAPALLLGEGFGALVALDAAKRHPAVVAGLVLVDTPLFAFVPEATQALGEQRSALEEALRDGGRAAAITVATDGRVTGDADAAGFFADYAGLASWAVTRRELRALAVPAAVLTRPGAAPHVLAASDALAALLPLAERVRDGDPVAAAAAR